MKYKAKIKLKVKAKAFPGFLFIQEEQCGLKAASVEPYELEFASDRRLSA